MQPGKSTPRLRLYRFGLELDERFELLLGDVPFAGIDQCVMHPLAQRDQVCHIQSGVFELGRTQWSLGPVGCAMSFAERDGELLLDECGQIHPLETKKPAGQLGVEEASWVQIEFTQTWQILCCGMQDPLVGCDGIGEVGKIRHRDRIDEPQAGTFSVYLDEVRPLAVPKSRGSFGIDGNRARSCA